MTRYVLELEPLPGIDPTSALRRALKQLLRGCGLRAINVLADVHVCGQCGLVITESQAGGFSPRRPRRWYCQRCADGDGPEGGAA